MKIMSDFADATTFRICAAVAILTGCSALQTQNGLQVQNGLQLQTSALTPIRANPAEVRADHQRSWMSPEAKNENLLYVSNLGNSTVSVYSVSGRRLVGMLTGLGDPYGLCTDTHGDVWIVLWGPSKVVEFAHGGTQILKSLDDPHGNPYDCSVDPTTGNLAVTNWNFGGYWYQGNVAVYAHASGIPHLYNGEYFWYFYGCAYDDRGNLYADGIDAYLNGTFVVGVLPKGGTSFSDLYLRPGFNPTVLAGVGWDGTHLLVGDGQAVWEYRVTGVHAKAVGYTPLNPWRTVSQFWVSARNPRSIVASNYGDPGFVHYWSFPSGGQASRRITDALDAPYGLTVSLAKN
jgi:hypothetical protein